MASKLLSFKILFCSFVFLPPKTLGFICPGPVHPPNGFSYARIKSNISGRASQEYAKIRIKLIYLASINDKPYKRLVEEAADFWTNALSVKPTGDRLFKSRDCESENSYTYKASDGSEKMEQYCLGYCNETTQCFDVEVPEEHLDSCKFCNVDGKNCSKNESEVGSGVENADLVFYVTAVDTTLCLNVAGLVAYAAACDIEPVLDRPVFALINICPNKAASYDEKTLLKTIKHEMMHALGFSFDTFKLFRDKFGKPLWPRDKKRQPRKIKNFDRSAQNVFAKIPREWHVRGKVIKSERLFLVTPSVVREARHHFGCPDLEGAELENFGPVGTKDSHFEARVFYDSAMQGNINTGKGLFSRLDFAVLEDSGWYQVNYSQAEDMEFGRGLGCDFCMKSCKFWMDKKREEGESLDPYCDTPDFMNKTHFFCNGTKIVFAGCPLISYHPYQLPGEYQHFDRISGVNDSFVPTFGSFDGFPDLCPVLLENLDVTSRVVNGFQCEREPTPAMTWEPNLTRGLDSTSEPWEPNSTWKPKPTMTLNPTTSPNPVEEAKDDEDETNECSHLGSSILLVIPFALMVIML